jgi:hypothetical protein
MGHSTSAVAEDNTTQPTTDSNEVVSSLLLLKNNPSIARGNVCSKEECHPDNDKPQLNASSTIKPTRSVTPPCSSNSSASTTERSTVVGDTTTHEETHDGKQKRNPATSCNTDKSVLSMPFVVVPKDMEIEPLSAGQNKKRKSLSDDEENITDASTSSSLDDPGTQRDINDARKKPGFRENRSKQKRINHGSWKTEELGLFLLGIELYGTDWNQVSALVKTRSYIQVRSHAQYHFAKEEAQHALSRKYGEESDSDALPFTTEEEKQFMEALDIHGNDYLMIPKIAPLIPTRTAADVREHLRLYRFAQKQRLKEETKKKQEAEQPPAEERSNEDISPSPRPQYTVMSSPPYMAPYNIIQAPRTGAYATSTDLLAAQALAKAQSERSRLMEVGATQRLQFSQQAATRNAAALRNNSSGGSLPFAYSATYVPAPGAAPVRVGIIHPTPSGSTAAGGFGINNSIPAAAQRPIPSPGSLQPAATLRGSLAPSLSLADNLPSPIMELENNDWFQHHHHNIRQNEHLDDSNRHDDEPMLDVDVDEEGAETTEVEESDCSSDEEGDSSDSSSEDDEPSSYLPPFVEQLHNIPCGKTFVHNLLGKQTWKSESIGGVTVLSPHPL